MTVTSAGLVLAALIAISFVLYRVALPKPISGIPYNKDAAKSILGDLPEAMKWQKQTQELLSYVVNQCRIHDSPIVQLFMRPFSKPWVIVCDFRESQDIMIRRAKEFDRGSLFEDLFRVSMPANQVHMPTGDTWRAHRKLMNETMSTSFLHTAAAPQIYATTLTLMELWKEKARLAQDHPFSTRHDVFKGALDVIWQVTFGTDIGTTRTQVELLSKIDQVPRPGSRDLAVEVPVAGDPEDFASIMKVGDAIGDAMKSPIPQTSMWVVLNFFPSFARAVKRKDRLIHERLSSAWAKFSKSSAGDGDVKSAIDLITAREVQMAQKEGRAPDVYSPAIRDELFGFLMAGHETTSTTVCWGLKLLSTHQSVQKDLRVVLRETYKTAFDAGRVPSAEEITRTDIAYLDAVIEEILRCGITIPSNVRRAVVDTIVLGHLIPKGTNLFLMNNGPGYVDVPFTIDETLRSRSSQDSKDKSIAWDISDISVFKPERWLSVDPGTGSKVFDARSGPTAQFGAGPRGCFGRKLAYLELKIILTVLVWKFELQEVPEAYASFDADELITRQPQQCYLRLRKAE